ncbi:MAG: enediyne biosynthesis protein CalE3 [Micromonosporaceae bacterium]
MDQRHLDQRHLLMHQVMLGDRRRIDAYDKALSEAVTPGSVVADVGAGTLALTALALRYGAARVYALEADPQLAALASHLIEANGWSDRVILVPGDARLAVLPEKVDVLVAELMGNLGPEEDMARILAIVARRVLRAGGVVIPERLVSYLVPVQFDDEGWGVWRDGFLDMRLAVVQEHVRPEAQLHFFSFPPTLLAEPVVLADSAARSRRGRPQDTLRLDVDHGGCLQAVAGYFVATLAPGVTLANFPSYPGCNWAVWIWPLRHSAVGPGDEIRVRVRVPEGGRVVTDWRLDCQLLRKGTQ